MANEKINIDLEANFSSANKSLADLKEELRETKKVVNSLDTSTEKFSKGLNRIGQIKGALGKASQGGKEAASSFSKLDKNVEGANASLADLKKQSKNLKTLRDSAKTNTKAFDELGKELGEVNGKIRQAERAGRGLNSTGKKTKGVFSGLTGSFLKATASFAIASQGLEGVFRGVSNTIRGIVSSTAEFGKATSRVETLTQATEKQAEALSNQARELGSSTEFAATQVAEGQQFLAQAGFETEEIVDSLGGTLNLASAGQLELAKAADIASNVLSGFGLEAEEAGRASDVLAKASISSNTNVQQLGSALSRVAPISATLGVSLEETTAVLGQLGNAGIQGERAGTALRNIFVNLENQTPKATRALNDLGISVKDSEGNLRSITELTRDFGEANASTSDLVEIFGKRAGPQFAALIQQGADGLGELTGKLDEAGGTAERVAEDQLDNLAGDFTKLESATEGLQIAIGENLNGSLRESTQFVTNFTGALTNLIEGQESTIEQSNALNKVLDRIQQIVPVLVALFIQFTGAGKRLATSFSNAGKKTLQLSRVMRKSAGATRVAKLAFNSFKSALRSFAPLLIVEGIILLIQNFDKLKNSILGVTSAEKARKDIQKEVNSETVEARVKAAELFDETEKLTRGINDLTDKENLSASQTEELKDKQKERKELVDEINEQFPEFLDNLDSENISLEKIATAREKVNAGLRDEIRLKKAQEARQAERTAQVEAENKVVTKLNRLNNEGQITNEEKQLVLNEIDRQKRLTQARRESATIETQLANIRAQQANATGEELEKLEKAEETLQKRLDSNEERLSQLRQAADLDSRVNLFGQELQVPEATRNIAATAGVPDFASAGQEAFERGNIARGTLADPTRAEGTGGSEDTEETKKNEQEKRDAKKKTAEATDRFNKQIEALEANKQKRLNDIQERLNNGEINERQAKKKTLEVEKDVADKQLKLAKETGRDIQKFRKQALDAEKALQDQREKAKEERFANQQSNIRDETAQSQFEVQQDDSLSEDEKSVQSAQAKLKGLEKELELARKFGEDEVELKRKIERQKQEIEDETFNKKKNNLQREFEAEKQQAEIQLELGEITREEETELILEAEEKRLNKLRELKKENGESVKQIDRDLALNQAKQKNTEVATTQKGEQLKFDAVLQFAKSATAISKIFGENSIAALIFEKSAAVAQTIVKGVVEIAEINRKFASNPPLAAALSTAAKIRTAVNVASIVATAIPSPPKIKEPGGGEGDQQGGGGGPQRTLAKGGILDGPSHAEGGIPMFSGGRQVAEAEGGEIVLAKGVSSNPTLLKEASKLNEAAGGSSLAPRTKLAEGGITLSGGGIDPAAAADSSSRSIRALERLAANADRQPVVDVREITSTQRKVQALQNTGNL